MAITSLEGDPATDRFRGLEANGQQLAGGPAPDIAVAGPPAEEGEGEGEGPGTDEPPVPGDEVPAPANAVDWPTRGASWPTGTSRR